MVPYVAGAGAILVTMVRRDAGDERPAAAGREASARCASPARESPVPVGVGASGSRSQVFGRDPSARAGPRKPVRRPRSRSGEQARGPQRQVKPAASTEGPQPGAPGGNDFRTGNASRCFNQIDGYVWRRLRDLRVQRKGRHLRPGEAARWTRESFENLGLYRHRGTVRYPEQPFWRQEAV